ncbi:MAG: IMP dehydrogenase [Acidimicrobiales bacterium]
MPPPPHAPRLDETGVYHVHVIADGELATGGDIAKAVVCGADAVMIGSPLAAAYGRRARAGTGGWPRSTRACPRHSADHPARLAGGDLVGPAHENDGELNLFGALFLRTSMATTGYETLKEFQEGRGHGGAGTQTEGKALQKGQGVGMGR